MDISTIEDVIVSIKTALDIANGLKDQNVTTAQSERINELTIAQLEALNSALKVKFSLAEMLENTSRLQKELKNVQTWDSQKNRYGLMAIDGCMAMVYALKETHRKDMPPHWICANCYRNSSRSILQPVRDYNGLWLLYCPSCKTEIHTGQDHQQTPVYI